VTELSIEVIDPVITKVHGDQKLIRPCMRYETEYWVKGPRFNYRKSRVCYAVTRKSFYTGLISRVQEYCARNDISLKIKSDNWNLKPSRKKPKLPEITFRPDQLKSIYAVIEKQRGLILAPTGSGKTILALGVASMFPKARILLLCHSNSIIRQTFKKAKSYGFNDVSTFGDGSKDISGRISFGTIQTLVNMEPKSYGAEFDIVIVDECHHVAPNGQYEKVLSKLLAPIRIGFTATKPKDALRSLILEGLIGPVIGELTIEEGIDLNILAVPTIKLVPVPFNKTIADKNRTYTAIYKAAIVENRARNRLVIRNAYERVSKGMSVLIMIKEITHGDILVELGKSLHNMQLEFVRGAVGLVDREYIQNCLNDKSIKCVICSSVWREGIDIPSLDTVIYASGGMSDTMTLQVIGRGLRRTKDKDKVEIVDFLDTYKYLSTHTVNRIQTYVESGWL